MILLGIHIAAFAHMGNNVEAELAGFFVFAVVLAGHGNETFSEADETDAQSAVLNDVAERVVRPKFLATEPVALTHEEWEVANVLVGLELIAFKQFVGNKIHFFVELFVVARPVGFLAFAKDDTMLDAEADKVDRSEGKIAATSRDTIGFRENAAVDTSAAAHGRNFSAIVARNVVFKVERSVDEDEVREEALRGNFHAALEEVVVRIFRVVVDTFFNFEDRNREDWGFAVAKTSFSRVEESLRDKATRSGRVGAEVNRSERNLSASAGMHSIEVVDEAFHGLESLFFDVGVRALDNFFRNAELLSTFFVAVDEVFWNLNVEFLAGEVVITLKVTLQGLAETFVDARSHGIIEVRDRLAAMLLVLVGLEDDGSEGAVASDRIRGAEVAMTGIETAVFKEAERIGLAAGQGTGGVEVEVVDMNLAVIMSGGEFWTHQNSFREDL